MQVHTTPLFVCFNTISLVVYSGLNLLSFYHDSILTGANLKTVVAGSVVGPTLTDLQRYLKFWTRNSAPYRWLSNFLSVIKIIEVVVEMAAHKRIDKERKWSLIVMLEMAKAIARLALIYVTKGRPLIYPLVPERPPEFAHAEVTIKNVDAGGVGEGYVGQMSNKTFASMTPLQSSLDNAINVDGAGKGLDGYKNVIYKYLSDQAGTIVRETS
jgi:hypothetical protein